MRATSRATMRATFGLEKPRIAGKKSQYLSDTGENPMKREGPLASTLTKREQDLVRGLISGLTLKQTAYNLGLTPGTAKIYLSHARDHAGCSTTYSLIAEYVEQQAEAEYEKSVVGLLRKIPNVAA
jgi:DNA-binding CsgD family transcriptional regulator